jgi:DUF4097 and DUF4098 domain-containing protein YvlB
MAGNKTLALIIPCCALAVACFPEERMVQQYDDVLPAEGLTSLHVVMGSGDLRIEGREGLDEIRVEVRVFTQLADCDGDAEVLDDMDYELYATTEGEARLWVDVDDDWMAYWADVTVYAPAALALDVRDTNGDIDISDFASLVLDDENGDTTIERIAGDVEIEDGTGDLRLAHIGGALTIDDGNGDIDVLDVVGPVEIADGTGDLWIEELWSNLRIEDGNGDMDLRFIDGDVVIDDGTGDIDVRDVTGTVTIHDGSGDIHAENVGDLEVIEDASGDIDWD